MHWVGLVQASPRSLVGTACGRRQVGKTPQFWDPVQRRSPQQSASLPHDPFSSQQQRRIGSPTALRSAQMGGGPSSGRAGGAHWLVAVQAPPRSTPLASWARANLGRGPTASPPAIRPTNETSRRRWALLAATIRANASRVSPSITMRFFLASPPTTRMPRIGRRASSPAFQGRPEGTRVASAWQGSRRPERSAQRPCVGRCVRVPCPRQHRTSWTHRLA